jgi:hypothetical protein
MRKTTKVALALAVGLAGSDLAQAQGHLEIPAPGSYMSGIGVLSGWNCNATRIEIEFDGVQTVDAAYGTVREDTLGVCGDSDNGFALLWNFNRLGDGPHTVRALADGVEFGRATFTVVTLGQEFLRGASNLHAAPDFPFAGTNVALQWQENMQNFAIVGISNVSLDGTYKLARVTLSRSSGILQDTADGSMSASGAMTISGGNLSRSISLTLGGVTASRTDDASFVDQGSLFSLTSGSVTHDLAVLAREPALITLEQSLSLVNHSMTSTAEVDQWVKVGNLP